MPQEVDFQTVRTGSSNHLERLAVPLIPNPPDRDNVSVKANPFVPSKGDYDTMARRRFQAPRPRKEGRWWVLYYWQDEFKGKERSRCKKRQKLAPIDTPEREVKKIAAEFLRPMNQGLQSIGAATGFEEYVDAVYIPVVLPQMARSTQLRSLSVIKIHLRPHFGGMSFREITSLTVDRYFASLGSSGLQHESLDKVRDVLSAICVSAIRYQLLLKNPVEGVRLPPPKRGKRMKPWISQEQFSLMLAMMQEPYATIVFVAMYTGLRPSELAGLRWRNVHADAITIDERYCQGEWGSPKSEASNATIAVNAAVIERIEALKSLVVSVRAGNGTRRYKVVKSAGPEDLVFQSVSKDAPIRKDNILTRHIKPAARAAGLGFVNWQVLRRSFATHLKRSGADVKDAQGLMRHSRASTTLDVYQQFIPESQRRVADRLIPTAHSKTHSVSFQ
jgi:integrase